MRRTSCRATSPRICEVGAPTSTLRGGTSACPRLDRFLAEHAGDLSRSAAARLIKSHLVRVNGQTADPADRVVAGDVVDFEIPEAYASEAAAEEIRREAGGEVLKQYRLLDGAPVIRHALARFVGHPEIDAVQPVIHRDDAAPFARASAGLALSGAAFGGRMRGFARRPACCLTCILCPRTPSNGRGRRSLSPRQADPLRKSKTTPAAYFFFASAARFQIKLAGLSRIHLNGLWWILMLTWHPASAVTTCQS